MFCTYHNPHNDKISARHINTHLFFIYLAEKYNNNCKLINAHINHNGGFTTNVSFTEYNPNNSQNDE
jgi:hypothetical protein